ncbi:MAG TPA: DUF4410 domain-containing protein [Candidatus Binatia bacterium]|jgi:hypothetical protein
MARRPANVFSRLLRSFFLATPLALTVACAQTSIRPIARTADKNLPPPARILVYDFTISEAEVIEYDGIMRQQPSIRDPIERRWQIGRIAGEALAVTLTDKLRHLGFTVERASSGASAEENDLVIDGRFLIVDQGNPLRRLIFGSGAGAAMMQTRVQVIAAGQRKKVLEFATQANSGTMPGAVATAPIAAMIPFGVSAGLTAGSAVATRLSSSPSDVTQMAVSSADEAVCYLSEFFAKLGWIKSDQVMKARITY